MKAKEIRDLIDFISQSDLDEVNIETPEFKISVRKNSASQSVKSDSQENANDFHSDKNRMKPASDHTEQPAQSKPESQSKYIPIKSPMIGTFYESPNPESAPFLSVGDQVKAGQTVCIIEAMKLFNEIESEVSGKVVKILVDNSSPVEFDQPLFLVDPS
jgi:acetyl-CoA carboxylase biotin carboxyl carrier protein